MKIKDYITSKLKSANPAILYDDEVITYDEVFRKASALSTKIKDICHDRCNIAILLPNIPEYVFAYFGVLLSDNIVVPIYYNSSNTEVINALQAYDISIIITDKNHIQQLLNSQPLKYNISAINIFDYLETTIAGSKAKFPLTKATDDIAVLLGTSGSTSNPKRAMLTDSNLLENAKSIVEAYQYTSNDIFMIVSSMAFSATNTAQFLVATILHATIVFYNGPLHPAKILQYINKYSVTTISIVPSILRILVNYKFNADLYPHTLRFVCCSGAIAPAEDIKKFSEIFIHTEITNNYGLTEASPRLTCQRYAEKNPLSVGQLLKNIELKIVDEQFKEVPVNIPGQIIVRGPNITSGYYNNPSASASIIKNGWLLTGDIGHIDAQKNLYITGRSKNIIICNGMNIYPEEIEEILLKHPQVEDALVKGTFDSLSGERPIAYLVVKSFIDENELSFFCKQYLPRHKIPINFYFVTSLPKTQSGKTKRC